MRAHSILLAIDDEVLRQGLTTILQSQRWTIIPCPSKANILELIQAGTTDVVILNCCQRDYGETLALTQAIRRRCPDIPIVLMVKHSSEDLAIAALKAKITEYIKYPSINEELIAAVRRCLAEEQNGAQNAESGTETESDLIQGHQMVGTSFHLRQIKSHIAKVAPTDGTVLITGETGTGKELVAELIHGNSHRRGHPFVCINCAAIPDSLLESELFGYERGAFTGALTIREGLLKQAEGGTIFLDEIGDMSLYAQAKMLRAIETKIVCPLGGKRGTPVNIRLIAATNQDLKRMMEEGKFRQDLYFRLNVIKLHLLPLRERKEEIPFLLTHYLQELNRRFGNQVQGFTERAVDYLVQYDWPGNVRELKNTIEAVVIKKPGGRIDLDDFPELLGSECPHRPKAHQQTEKERLLAVLFATNWNKSKAAQKLHWSRMTLYRKMEKYRLVSSPPAGDSKTTG
jgi:DNA-binding NtrC family response regulator